MKIKRKLITCRKCGWRWEQRIAYPSRCPSRVCDSPYWDGPETPARVAAARAAAMALIESQTDTLPQGRVP